MLNSKLRQKQKRSRQEINDASWALKRKRKRKGLPSGSRFKDVNQDKNRQGNLVSIDPRIGSKKPIELTLDGKDKQVNKVTVTSETVDESKLIAKNENYAITEQAMLAAEQELQKLENDPQLDMLLDMKEQHKKLTDEQAVYLESMLNRIDELMLQLGYSEDDFDDSNDETNKKEDIVGLLKRK